MEKDFQRKMQDIKHTEQFSGIGFTMTLSKESFYPIALRIIEVAKKMSSKDVKNYLEKHRDSISDGIILIFDMYVLKNKKIIFLSFVKGMKACIIALTLLPLCISTSKHTVVDGVKINFNKADVQKSFLLNIKVIICFFIHFYILK